MTKTKDFPTSAVLSVATGILMGGIDGVYEVCGWMTGESAFTHQLPRISAEATPVLIAAHPDLAVAIEEASQVTPDNCRDWLATWTTRYGETLAVPKFNADQHERIDLMSELAEKIHPSKIIAVEI